MKRSLVLALVSGAALLASSVATAGDEGVGGGSYAGDCPTTAERVAANIQLASGVPTPFGQSFLAAAGLASPAPSTFDETEDDEYSVTSEVIAEDATPVDELPQPNGSTPDVRYYCGLGVAVNQIWYCPPGNTCTSFIRWGARPPDSRTSACSWVYTNPCQVYTRADPPYYDYVYSIWYSRTISGPPVLGDRWCG